MKQPYEWEATFPEIGLRLRHLEALLEQGGYTPEQRRKQEWHLGHIRGIMQGAHNRKAMEPREQ